MQLLYTLKLNTRNLLMNVTPGRTIHNTAEMRIIYADVRKKVHVPHSVEFCEIERAFLRIPANKQTNKQIPMKP